MARKRDVYFLSDVEWETIRPGFPVRILVQRDLGSKLN